MRTASAFRARSGVGATAPKTSRASATRSPSRTSTTAALTFARSAVTRVIFRNAPPVPGRGGGNSTATSSSPGSRTDRPGPRKNSSTGRRRSPFGPRRTASAPYAMRAGAVSDAGDALPRFPPRVPMTWTCVVLKDAQASARTG
jgi:hypothetical protein